MLPTSNERGAGSRWWCWSPIREILHLDLANRYGHGEHADSLECRGRGDRVDCPGCARLRTDDEDEDPAPIGWHSAVGDLHVEDAPARHHVDLDLRARHRPSDHGELPSGDLRPRLWRQDGGLPGVGWVRERDRLRI